MAITLLRLRRDFAARLQSEQRMRKVNDDLERGVRERTKALEQTASILEDEVDARRGTERKLESKLKRLILLQSITRAIAQRQDLQSVLRIVNESLERELPADFCCVCLHGPQGELEIACVGPRSEALADELALRKGARVEIEANGFSRSIHGQLVHEPDLREVRFPFMQTLARGGLGSVVAAPLIVESTVFGVQICARRPPGSFSSGDREFLQQLSEHVALAAHQAQLYGTLQKTCDDLTQTQTMALQQERLLALGQMASGVAHDISNTLSPVGVYVETLRDRESQMTAAGHLTLQRIGNAVGHVTQTLRRMREFYRPGEPLAAEPIELNTVIQEAIEITRPRWADPSPQTAHPIIDLRTELTHSLPPIVGVASELRDALVNLILNAVDAMPEGGALMLRTSVTEEASSGLRAGSQFVRLEVSDTGAGMSDETRKHCLEPFFTTKGDQGTGLGLATVYGTMQRHGSDIEIESGEGEGTNFRFSFPALGAHLSDVATPALQLPSLPVLVVDDDELVASMICEMLEKEGHRPSMAAGGQAAIDAFLAAQSRGEPFRAVITDLSMPQVDGLNVCDAVKAAAPGTVVILLTGWGRAAVERGSAPAHVDCVVTKPPSRGDLRAALGRCIARH